MKTSVVLVLLLSTIGTSGFIAHRLHPSLDDHTNGAHALDAHESHAAVSLVGQARTSLSGWLWVRADLYLHNGVEMRPLTEQEIRAGDKAMASSDGLDEKMHQEGVVTVIPEAQRDFRGIFGDVERQVSTYRDMHGHDHKSPQQSLPLFRLMTWLDPQFTPGWSTGAHIISLNKKPDSTQKALTFLEDGIRHNPQSIALHGEKAALIISHKKDLVGAIPILQQCIALGDRERMRISEEEAEALQSAYRYLALVYREVNQAEEMKKIARRGLKIFTDDQVLARLAQ